MLPVHECTLNDNKVGKYYCAHFTGEDTEVRGGDQVGLILKPVLLPRYKRLLSGRMTFRMP